MNRFNDSGRIGDSASPGKRCPTIVSRRVAHALYRGGRPEAKEPRWSSRSGRWRRTSSRCGASRARSRSSLVGSVAQGRERADSDVDVYLVVDDERFAAETAAGRFAWVDRWGVDYPGSYIDIKLASPAYLETAAEQADDPTRASFLGARIAFSRMPGLEDAIARITTLPDDVWDERVRSHVAQARLYGGYFLRQAVERGDEFLRRHAGLHLTLAAARAALAADHVMLPGPKYISQARADRAHARRVRDGVGPMPSTNPDLGVRSSAAA